MLMKGISWVVCSCVTLSSRGEDTCGKRHRWRLLDHCTMTLFLVPYTYQSTALTIAEMAPKRLSKAFTMTVTNFLTSSLENIFSTKLPGLVNAVLNERTSVDFLYDSLFLMFLKGLSASLHAVFRRWVSTFLSPDFLVPGNEGGIQHVDSGRVYHWLQGEWEERQNKRKSNERSISKPLSFCDNW